MEHVAVAEAPRVELTRRLTECTTYVKRTLNQYNQDFKAISFKHEATPLTAIAGSCVTLGGLQYFQAFVKLSQPQSMILIGSTAALSSLLFAAPAAPLGIPYNTICGHCVSVAIAVLFHWLQELIGMDLVANVYAPSLAIGAMAMLKVSNPPAAAACFIFVTSAKAQAQPLHGAFFLVAPALVGCGWALAVQYLLSRSLAVLKGPDATPPDCAALWARGLAWIQGSDSAPTQQIQPKKQPCAITLHGAPWSVVDPAVTTAIEQALDGATYVDDPLSFMIDTLTQDRQRMARQRKALRMMQGKRSLAGESEPEARRIAAERIQGKGRMILAAKRMAEKKQAKNPTVEADRHLSIGETRAQDQALAYRAATRGAPAAADLRHMV